MSIHRDRRRHPEAKAIPGVIVYRFSGLLFFANCGVFRSRAEAFIEKSPKPLHGFVLDASVIFDVDLAACDILSEFHFELGVWDAQPVPVHNSFFSLF